MAPIGKILLRFKNPNKRPSKLEISEALQKKNHIWLINLKPIKTGFIAMTELEDEIEKLLTEQGRSTLEKLGLEVSIPPKIRAERAVLCRKVDPQIGSNSAEDILNEINDKNEALVAKEVIKFGAHTHVFKIEFQNTKMANFACQKGILAFNLKMSQKCITKEKYVELLVCFQCYKMEEHHTKDCPFTNLPRRCSECAGLHEWTQCKKDTPKQCINCPVGAANSDHRTLAMRCPVRKKLMKEKTRRLEEREQENQNKTFATVAKIAINQQQKHIEQQQLQQQQQQHKPIEPATGLAALIMILDAHISNMVNPGSYNSRIKASLKANGMPEINLPPTDFSEEIFSLKHFDEAIVTARNKKQKGNEGEEAEVDSSGLNAESANEDEEIQDILRTHEETNISASLIINESKASASNNSSHSCRRMSASTPLPSVQACEAQVAIYIKDTTKGKKGDLSPKETLTLYLANNLKYQLHHDTVNSQDFIEELISSERLTEVKDRIHYIKPSSFEKIPNGIRQPAPNIRGTRQTVKEALGTKNQ